MSSTNCHRRAEYTSVLGGDEWKGSAGGRQVEGRFPTSAIARAPTHSMKEMEEMKDVFILDRQVGI